MWHQVFLRKIENVPCFEKDLEEINTSVVIGTDCPSPLTSSSPYFFDFSTDHSSIADIMSELSKNELCNSNEIKFIFSSNVESEQLQFLDKNCILKLDGAFLDLEITKKTSIGAYLIDLTEIYPSLSQYEDQKRYLNINSGCALPFQESSNKIIDFILFKEPGHPIGEWIFSLRKLFYNVPFGIRVPANFVERDIFLAATWEVDFIIFDCTDTIIDDSIPNVVLPSLPTLARATSMINKLPKNNITLIFREPKNSVNHLKMFALGCAGLIINNTASPTHFKDINSSENNYSEIVRKTYQLMNESLLSLKYDLHHCGCKDIFNANKTHLLTNSEVIKNSTSINHIFDPDLISVPYYNLNKTSRRSKQR